jgi:uncharacterized membrane-anchored protein
MVALTSKSNIMLNKVPEVTIYFWVIKILSTTVGETAADLLSIRLDLGLSITSVVMSLLLAIALLFQFRARRYIPSVYWLSVVLISVVGTLISDNLVDGMGIPLTVTSIAFALALLVTFVSWYRSERTLSIHTIVTTRRETFYWAAILFTFAMGTSLGDLVAEQLDLGYLQAALLFGSMIAFMALLYYVIRLDAVFCFWVTYILTRPLGASLGDWMAMPNIAGGLGLGTVATSLIFVGIIFFAVIFLTVTRSDEIRDQSVNA